MSQQPGLLSVDNNLFGSYIWQVVCNISNNNNTHTLESVHIFLESNYKEKLVKKVRGSIGLNIYLCVIRNFNTS